MNLVARSASRELHDGVEGLWSDDEVTPTRDDQNRRSTDASKLTFPLQLVVVIVATIVGMTGAFWVATSSLRSDVRDILTRMEMQSRDQDMRYSSVQEKIKDLESKISAGERRQELMRLEYQQLREQLLFGKKDVK